MKLGYYPGCSLHATAVEYDESMRAVCGAAGVELEEVPGWTCCGSTPAHAVSHLLAVALPMRVLQKAAGAGIGELMVPCASCYQRLRAAQHEVAHAAGVKEKVAAALGGEIGPDVGVVHPLGVFGVGGMIEEIRRLKRRNLTGMKVCCYYGCLLTRPPRVTGFDDCEYPVTMDRIVGALGARPLDWNGKTVCCGASLALTRTDCVRKLVGDILRDARRAGADAVAVACPLCQANLDARQEAAGEEGGIPILYFSQLMGLAFGAEAGTLGLQRLLVSPLPMLSRLGLT